MQLPRGTFRSIRKGVRLGEVLEELASSRFTGICTISSAAGSGALVYRNGTCTLAKFQDRYGDPALQIIMEQPDLVADLALSDLTVAQLQLALDYNKKALVSAIRPVEQRAKVATPAPAAPATVPSRQKHPKPAGTREGKEREFIKTTPAAEAVPVPPTIPERTGTAPAQPPADHPPEEDEGEPGQSPAEKDLDTFEDMDLDDVAQKIRKDCKIILKQLQLDHLTEK